jgi:hypothetical protein
MRCRVEQSAKDARPSHLKFAPKLGLGSPPSLGNRRQGKKNCTIGQIGPG